MENRGAYSQYVRVGGAVGTREVSSYFDDGDVWEDRHVLSCPTFLDFILPHSPFLFLGRNIHWTIKRLGPPIITLVPYKHNLLDIRRIEMRMTDRNGFQSAKFLYRLHSFIIQIRNTVP